MRLPVHLIGEADTCSAQLSTSSDMRLTMMKDAKRRADQRNPIEAGITCRPFASDNAVRTADGVMRNFSGSGSCIETSCIFKPGAILIVRMIRYPLMPTSMADQERPRSICLAEVRWQRELAGETPVRYAMGLRYLD
jgi:hypothetical protein